MVAQVKTKQVAPPKVDCKYVEEKGKDGKIIYKFIGKDCPEAVAKMEKSAEQEKAARGRVYCECTREEGHLMVCKGSCCPGLAAKAGIPMALAK